MLQCQIEVVALLWLQIRIAVNHLHACHIKVHIHLLEGWSPESSCIIGTHGESIPLCHQSQTSRCGMLAGCREVVMTKACHNVQPLQRIIIELRKGVARVLAMRSVVGKLICGEIVIEKISTKSKGVVAKHVGIERTQSVLTIGVVVVVGAHIVDVAHFVVLVEAIRNLQVIVIR